MRTKMIAKTSAVLATAALALTGCAGGSDGDSTGNALSTELPPKDTTATLDIWGYIEPEQATGGWITNAIERMKDEYPNVEVEYTYIPYDQIGAKLLGTSVSGGSPDGVIYNPADAANLAQSGVLADMSPFWDEYADAEQFPDAVVWKLGDEVISIQGYVNTTALYYNKDILDAAGAAPPTTVDELGDALEAVTNAGYQGMTMSAVPTAESEFQIFPWLLGEGQNYGAWDEEVVTEVFQQFKNWIDAGYIPREVVGYTQGDAWDQFTAGDFAFTQNGNWQLGLAEELPFNWGVVPIPAGTEGSFSVGGGEGFSMGAETENPALTWNFFKKALLEKDSQLSILAANGSLPARSDAADATEIESDPNLAVFADVVSNLKARPSTSEMGAYLITMGKIWNSVAGGETSPEDAASEVVSELSDVE